ncbi:hypothetical protein ACHQM5_018257 [Ranunculus cassubicifolius]
MKLFWSVSSPLVLLFSCFILFDIGTARLSDGEVDALKEIAKTMGKKDWDFSVDPCGWSQSKDNNVTCYCRNGRCNVNSMYVLLFYPWF